ncbi:MAG TPA: CBS domain-containing protein [Candidatus Omnitrophota bacterium]|nr:CBS domain-containing protein [Candidatus Omnitrophota bacterium]
MSTVRELLKEKGNHVWSIEPDASAYEALTIMAEKNIGALLVMHKGEIVGVFSERDYARNSIQEDRNNLIVPVGDFMTRNVLYVSPESTMEECMALMTGKHVRHLPVIDNNRLLGLISIGDVVKRIISAQKIVISELEKYVPKK